MKAPMSITQLFRISGYSGGSANGPQANLVSVGAYTQTSKIDLSENPDQWLSGREGVYKLEIGEEESLTTLFLARMGNYVSVGISENEVTADCPAIQELYSDTIVPRISKEAQKTIETLAPALAS